MSSNDRFKTIVASIGDGVIASDTHGCVTYMNAVAERLTGWTFIDAENRPITEVFNIINESTRAVVENPIDRVLHEGRIVGLANHTLLIRRDGVEFPIDDSGAPIFDEEGTLIGAVLVFRDISDRVMLQRKLEQQEAHLRLLAQNAQDLVYRYQLADPRGYIYVSPSAVNITGYTPEEYLADPYIDAKMVHPDDRKQFDAIIADLANQGNRVVTRVFHKDGHLLYLEHRFSLTSDAHGNLISLEGIARDITRQKLEEDRQKFMAEASALLSSTLDYEATLKNVVALAVPIIADWCSIDLVEPDGKLRQVALVNPNAEVREKVEALRNRYLNDPERPNPIGLAAQTGKSILATNLTDETLRMAAQGDEDVYQLLKSLGIRSMLYVPLMLRGEVLGVISFTTGHSGRVLNQDDVLLAEDLAQRAAVAIENAELFRDAQREEQRQRFMAEASTALVSSLDMETTLKNVAALAVPGIADWCAVDLFDENDKLRQVVVTHSERETLNLVGAVREKYLNAQDVPYPASVVARRSEATLLNDLSNDKVERAPEWDNDDFEILKRADLNSALYVPLMIRGESLGVVSFANSGSRAQLGQDEVDLGEELARRIAAAVETNRLYREVQNELARRSAAEADQRLVAQQLRLVTDSLPVLIAYVDREHRYRFNNHAYKNWFDLTSDSIISRHMRDVLGESAYATLRPYVEGALRGETIQYEALVPYAVAGARFVSGTYVPDIDENGQVKGFFSLVHDVSDRKQSERALHETNQRLQAIIESAPIGVIVFDVDGIVRMWSPSAERIFGWSADEAIGLFMPTIPPDKLDEFRATLATLMTGEPIINFQTRRRKKDGSAIEIIFSTAPLRNPDGQITAFITMTTDVTDRVQAEANLQAAYERTNEIVESISDAFYALDEDYRFTYVNRRAEADWKKNRSELIGQHIWEVFPEYFHKSEGGRRIAAAMRTREPQHFETLALLLNRWVAVNVYPQNTGGVSVYIHDISDRKRAEEAERATAVRLQTMMENMPIMLSVVDENNTQIIWNKEAERVTGYTLEDMQQGDSFYKLYPDPELQESISREMQTKRRNYRDWQFPTTCKDGSVRYISWSNVTNLVPIPGWADWALGVDVTERKLLEMDIARAYKAERSIREKAEAAASRIARLQAITAALTQAVTTDEVADICVSNSSEALGADRSGISILSHDGTVLEMRAKRGIADDDPIPVNRIPVVKDNPYGSAVLSQQPVWLATQAEYRQQFPEAAAMSTPITGTQTLVALPLKVEDHVIGMLAFSFKQEHPLDQAERDFMMALADQCAQAMERARLYEAEQAARRRMEFISNASTLLSASLEYEQTLQSLAALVVPRLADWYTVHLLDDNDELVQLVVHHKDPDKIKWGLALQKEFPDERNESAGLWKVLRTGESEFYPNIPDELLVKAAKNERQLELLRQIGYTAVIIVPLVSRDRIFGAITLVSTESGIHYEQADLELAKEIAHRAGIAIDKARLYREVVEQRRLAESLSDIALAVNSTLDVDQVSRLILENIPDVVPHDAADIILIEGEQGRIVHTTGLSDNDIVSIEKHLSGRKLKLVDFPIFQRMIQTHAPIVLGDVAEEPTWVNVPTDKPLPAYLSVPLHLRGKTIGFLDVRSSTPHFFTKAHVERLEALAAQASTAISNAQLYAQAQELAAFEERQRLARDLHDAVTQMLFSSSLIAESLPRLRNANSLEKLWERIEQLARLNRGAHAEMRNLLLQMRSSNVRQPELTALLEQLADAAMGRNPLKIALKFEGDYLLPPNVQAAFYRIAQESLNNTVKHARATTVDIILAAYEAEATLTITDNGRGFDPLQLRSQGQGLDNMHERANDIGARVTVTSARGQGTTVQVAWTPPQDA